ncbi:MAG: sugar ABC transporter substrate-binding protein [Clostridia bacterium]
MKRILSCVLVVLLAVSVLGTALAEQKTYNVAYIPGDMANESQAFSAKMMQKYGADYGLNVTILDGQGDAQVQAQVVTNAIAQGLDAIFINPNDINGIVPSLMEAKSAGLVVGMFSSDLPQEYTQYRDFFVGVNDNMAGETAGRAFTEHFPDGATIVEIGGQAGHDAQIKRHDGFMSVIKDSKITLLDSQCTNTWSTAEAMAIMEDFIVKYGDQIQGVFCHWDNGATGIIEALKAANMLEGMYLIGVDGCRAGFDQVRAGTQSVTIMQNFETQSQKTLACARALLDGGTVEELNFVPLDTVSLENIDQFEVPEW